MVNPKSNTTSAKSTAPIITPSAKTLQERLHELLSRLANTIEHVKNWPDGDETVINTERTKLISLIHDIIKSLQRVENVVKNDIKLKLTLQNCLIPFDLLDLLDYEINPDCFSRGLLKEVIRQLDGLKRRKNALEMLGSAIQIGLDKKDNDEQIRRAKKLLKKNNKIKKKREREENKQQQQDGGEVNTTEIIEGEPALKRIKVNDEDQPTETKMSNES